MPQRQATHSSLCCVAVTGHTQLPLLRCSDSPTLILHVVHTEASAFSDGRELCCRYLYTELSDPSFGDRASAVLGRFREADPGSEAMAGLAIQGQMMAQLSYIVDQLKASHRLALRLVVHFVVVYQAWCYRLGLRLSFTGSVLQACGTFIVVYQAWCYRLGLRLGVTGLVSGLDLQARSYRLVVLLLWDVKLGTTGLVLTGLCVVGNAAIT